MNNTLLQLCLILNNLSPNTYLVGGCVRDMLLGKNPKDFDLVCDIDLDLVSKTLIDNGWKVDEAGKQFLVMIASKNNEQFEIANFRNDGNYSDGRRPDSVTIATIEEDCLRRDFTINSLYYHPLTCEILDPTNKGLLDLKNKIIRFNGKASERVGEDSLRILRAYRFASQLGFSIETKSLKACRTYFKTMCETIAPERMRVEIEKMCLH
jgi:poly(A) polymerase